MSEEKNLIEGRTGKWEIILGLEVHAQVISEAKLFSGASTTFGADPNSQVSLVDAAFPGMLPVINKRCVEQAVRTGLGLKAEINVKSVFDRKNYFYADLPAGYQISQYTQPIVGKGTITLDMPDGSKRHVGITRLHLEQDAGKSLHDQHPTLSDSGTITFDDVDLTDTHSTSVTPAGGNTLGGILTANVTDSATGAGDGTVTWTYAVANSATQYLAEGQTATETFTIRISDNSGGFVDQVVTVTVAGTNDAPLISIESGDGASAELTDGASALFATDTLTATDLDVSDVMTASIQSVSVGGTGGVNGMTAAQLLALFSISPSPIDTALTTTGQITWQFNAAANVFDYLAASDVLTLTYTVNVSDGHGGSDTHDVTITIRGVNESILVPPPFTGAGDPNDNDAIGPAAGAMVTFTTSGGNADTYNGTNGDDTINTGQGDDTAYGHGGHDVINGEQGGDTSLYGQAGNDAISGGQASDEIFGGSGDDTLYGGSATMVTGTSNDTLYGGSGADTIFGHDGDDLIVGGYGADNLSGNAGADTFRYLSVLDTGDIIHDLEGAGSAGGDIIDLSAITTNFTGTTAAANSAWYATSISGDATVYVDTDGNTATAEFAITLKGVASLISTDFDLTP